jgi:iron/zinc/copper transport system ATP-binding protein
MKHEIILKVENLSVSYGGKKAIENITFPAEPKQLIGIIGPNGGGKSTLMKAIMGLVNIDAGKIEIMQQPVEKVCKQIAYVPQKNSLDLTFPVLVEDVVMMGRYPHISWWGLPRDKDYVKVDESLKLVGLTDLRKRQIGQLSGGQQQRVFLARALAQEAEVFFLDEPFAGIDAASENMMMKVLKNLKNQGKTIFVVHHDLSKVHTYFDSLILLKKNLIAYGPKDKVFRSEYLTKAYEGSTTIRSSSEELLVMSC